MPRVKGALNYAKKPARNLNGFERKSFDKRVWALTEQNFSIAEIAKYMRCTDRTISNSRRRTRERLNLPARGESTRLPEPKTRSELSEEALACVSEFTPECFEQFFNRYSPYKLLPHSRRIVQAMIGPRQVVVTVPPGHAKSTIASIWLPLWLICRDRNVMIILLSNAEDLAQEFCRTIAFELENNETLVQDFGYFKPVEQKSPDQWQPGSGKLKVAGTTRATHGPTLLTRGLASQIPGFRADWLIADDTVNIKNAGTDADRKKLHAKFNIEIRTRLAPTGYKIVVGTRYHPDDLYGYLTAKVEYGKDHEEIHLWRHVNFPALSDPDTGEATMDWERGVALWEDPKNPDMAWGKDRLYREVFSEIGSAEFQQVYQQQAMPEGSLRFPSAFLTKCLDANRRIGEGMPSALRRCRVISLDPAPSRNAGFVVADIGHADDPHHRPVWVIDALCEPMGVREMLANLEESYQRFGPIDYLIVEANSVRLLLDQFSSWCAFRHVHFRSHETSVNKNNGEWGVDTLAVPIEFGALRFPDADVPTRQRMAKLVSEFRTYPYSATTDGLMACWFIWWNLRWLQPRSTATTRFQGFNSPARLQDGFAWAKKGA